MRKALPWQGFRGGQGAEDPGPPFFLCEKRMKMSRQRCADPAAGKGKRKDGKEKIQIGPKFPKTAERNCENEAGCRIFIKI